VALVLGKEHHLEWREFIWPGLGGDAFQQLSERQTLVRVGTKSSLAHTRKQFVKRWIVAEAGAKKCFVAEAANQSFHFQQRTVCGARSDADFFMVGITLEQALKTCH